MLSELLSGGVAPVQDAPKEGDLYRVVTTFGRTFELRYGYYTDIDRGGEPDVIYPDFTKTPLYTEKGEPFTTIMQNACKHFRGGPRQTDDTSCAECGYFKRGEEWFGICTCPKNREST